VKEGVALLDLDYDEDSTADVDMNVVAIGDGKLVEVQGTAEGKAFGRGELDAMLDLALEGIAALKAAQLAALG
jgi:ribonuclease PH